jgi:hypothetical protein
MGWWTTLSLAWLLGRQIYSLICWSSPTPHGILNQQIVENSFPKQSQISFTKVDGTCKFAPKGEGPPSQALLYNTSQNWLKIECYGKGSSSRTPGVEGARKWWSLPLHPHSKLRRHPRFHFFAGTACIWRYALKRSNFSTSSLLWKMQQLTVA